MDPMTIMAGASLVPTLFGSGGRVSVPGAMARPTDPTSKFVDDTGMLREQFKTAGLTNEMLESGKGLLGNLKSRAMAEGPSTQAQYLQQANQLGQQAQRDAMSKAQASSQATQQANLAMKGGLGSGARERMAGQYGQQAMMGAQDIARGGAQNNLNILAQDEATKLGLMQQLPGQYQSFGNEQMRRQVGDTQGGASMLMDKYGRDMQAFGANQMARAQAQSQNAASKGLLGGLFG
jgi:hypothetical protein